jgi:hypothetical protein
LHSYAAVQAALATIWISVALGAALGISQRFARGATGPIRTFAVVAAGLVVSLSLLPHALASEGVWGLLGAVAGFAAIPAVEYGTRALFQGLAARAIRLEVGYAGLLVHRFGDGLAMSVDGHGHDVLIALGAHEIPIVALVTLAYMRQGLAQAMTRAALLGLASTVGCWIVKAMPEAAWHGLHGWADAIAAGILIHIVSQEISSERPMTSRDRTLDMLGGGVALLIVCLSGGDHADGQGLSQLLLASASSLAPALCLGLLSTAALLATRVGSSADAWSSRRGAQALGGKALTGVVDLLGAPRPVPPVAPLEMTRARPGRLAPLLSVREWRPDVLALSIQLLGWRLTALRASGALIAAIVAVLLASVLRPVLRADVYPALARPDVGSWGERFWVGLDSIWIEDGAWLALGLLAGTYLNVFLPEAGLVGPLNPALQLLSLGALTLAVYLSPLGATPIMAALLYHGLSASTALVGVLLGAASHWLFRCMGKNALGLRWLLPLGSILTLGAYGLSTVSAGGVIGPALPLPTHASWLHGVCLVLLASLMARNMWQLGIRGWFAASLLKPDAPEHAHHASSAAPACNVSLTAPPH